MNTQRRKLSFTVPTKPYAEVVGTDRAIESYNRLLTLPKNSTIDRQIAGLKEQLVKLNVITNDHEGPIQT
jgi:hypothetical protein